MKLIDLTCSHCGAELQIDPSKIKYTCPYCGSTVLIDNEIKHLKLDNGYEFGYSKEKGRQQALREAQSNNMRMRQQQESMLFQEKQRWVKVYCWQEYFSLYQQTYHVSPTYEQCIEFIRLSTGKSLEELEQETIRVKRITFIKKYWKIGAIIAIILYAYLVQLK